MLCSGKEYFIFYENLVRNLENNVDSVVVLGNDKELKGYSINDKKELLMFYKDVILQNDDFFLYLKNLEEFSDIELIKILGIFDLIKDFSYLESLKSLKKEGNLFILFKELFSGNFPFCYKEYVGLVRDSSHKAIYSSLSTMMGKVNSTGKDRDNLSPGYRKVLEKNKNYADNFLDASFKYLKYSSEIAFINFLYDCSNAR